MSKWKEFDVDKKLVPKFEESDRPYLIVLNNRFINIAYYYRDTFNILYVWSTHNLFFSFNNIYNEYTPLLFSITLQS